MEKIRLGLVVAEFNSEITMPMLERAREYCSSLGADLRYICKAPGSFDMPLLIKLLLEKEDVDAIVALGAIVEGETEHDEVIAHQVAQRMAELSLSYGKPVTLGISGPGMSWEQGVARIDEYARRAVEAAVKMSRRAKLLKEAKAGEGTVVIE